MQTFFCSFNLPSCSPQRQLVETYKNGESWYRVYSDGWCEQGGLTEAATTGTATFQKQFLSTDYSVISTIYRPSGGNSYAPEVRVRSVDSVDIHSAGAYNKFWVVKGYITPPLTNNIKQIIKY